MGREVFEAYCPSSEVERVGVSVDLSLCVLVVPLSVPVVAPFSNEIVVCEVFCFL